MAVPRRSTVSSKVVGASTGLKTASRAALRSIVVPATLATVHPRAHRATRLDYSARLVEVRQENVVVETDRYRVEGKLTLPAEGYRSRLSDQINRRDQEFFTITDAQLVSLDGSGRDWSTPVLMLARRHIRLIVPVDGDA